MQEQRFQAGLGNVHIVQLGSGRLRGGDDAGNERAAAVGINVGGDVVGGAHFGDARQASQDGEQFLRRAVEAQAQQVAAGNGGFQFLWRALRDDAAVVDDGQAVAQGIGYLRSEEHTSELQSPCN